MLQHASYILFPVHWFQPTGRDCPNPVKCKFKVIVVVVRAFLWKDLGTRVSVYGLGFLLTIKTGKYVLKYLQR